MSNIINNDVSKNQKGEGSKVGNKPKNISQPNIKINDKNKTNQNVINIPFTQEDDINMEQEQNNCLYGNQQLQCQEKINIQLFMRRQKNYSDTFKNCYNTMKDYLKNPFQSKGNFLWTLECFCSMVDLWNNDYPDYEPHLSKEFNKEKIKLEIKNYEMQLQTNKNYDSKLFNKFYHLVNNEKQNHEDENVILSHFPDVKPNETNVMSNATNLINLKRKVDNDNEREEFYGFPNFDVDPKLKHLRSKK